LELDPNHPSLRLHPLKGKLKDLYSISINISYRITLEIFVTDKEIVLVRVGHHGEVY
jgi:mRNA-degrading endonuclease YafQ of YafQ-DinJ toxin-antitoxin module